MRQRVLQDIQIKWSKCKIASSTVNYNKIKKDKKTTICGSPLNCIVNYHNILIFVNGKNSIYSVFLPPEA